MYDQAHVRRVVRKLDAAQKELEAIQRMQKKPERVEVLTNAQRIISLSIRELVRAA